MRINHIYGRWALGLRGTFAPITEWQTDARSLTGSELACLRCAQEQADMGHDVHLYTVSPPDTLPAPGGASVSVHPMSECTAIDGDLSVAWLWPRDLLEVKSGLRVCHQTVNDFDYVGEERDAVDRWIACSAPHQQMLKQRHDWLPDDERMLAIELGCDPHIYEPATEPGRVTYASAPGRGLHHLLTLWPEVSRRVPHARLHVYYHVEKWLQMMEGFPSDKPEDLAQKENARIVRELIGKTPHTTVHQTVSRRRMAQVWNRTEVMAYPCDPVNHFTEGFSCSTLEACASGSAPVIMAADALPALYGTAAVMVPRGDTAAFTEELTRMLTDLQARNLVSLRAIEHAKNFTWRRTAQRQVNLV